MVVTARMLVVLSGSFTSQIDDVKARVVTMLTMVVQGETKGGSCFMEIPKNTTVCGN